jgi:hypothetical protein
MNDFSSDMNPSDESQISRADQHPGNVDLRREVDIDAIQHLTQFAAASIGGNPETAIARLATERDGLLEMAIGPFHDEDRIAECVFDLEDAILNAPPTCAGDAATKARVRLHRFNVLTWPQDETARDAIETMAANIREIESLSRI